MVDVTETDPDEDYDERDDDPDDYDDLMPPAREEPDWDEIDHERHLDEVHDGGPCNCPPPTPEEIEAQWAEREREHRAEVHDGAPCDCPPPF